jgi:hypothetical protein
VIAAIQDLTFPAEFIAGDNMKYAGNYIVVVGKGLDQEDVDIIDGFDTLEEARTVANGKNYMWLHICRLVDGEIAPEFPREIRG